MNRGQFKDPSAHMFVAGTVAASWSLPQEVAGLKLTLLTNISSHWIQRFQRKLKYVTYKYKCLFNGSEYYRRLG